MKYDPEETRAVVDSIGRSFSRGGFDLVHYHKPDSYIVLMLSDEVIINELNLGYIKSWQYSVYSKSDENVEDMMYYGT